MPSWQHSPGLHGGRRCWESPRPPLRACSRCHYTDLNPLLKYPPALGANLKKATQAKAGCPLVPTCLQALLQYRDFQLLGKLRNKFEGCQSPFISDLKGWRNSDIVLCSPPAPQGRVAEEQTPPWLTRSGGNPLPADEAMFVLNNLNDNFHPVCSR